MSSLSKSSSLLSALLLSGCLAALSHGQEVSYECDSFPEDAGWALTTSCSPTRTLKSGDLVEQVDVGCGGPPRGDGTYYRRSIADFADADSFFFEWRVLTDGDRSEIVGVAPCFFVTWDLYGVSYHFTIASDQVRLIRDNFLPILVVDTAPDIVHTHRLELWGPEEYRWFIDGQIVAAGTPEGTYPTPTAAMAWGTNAWYLPNTTRWSYVRYGVIADDASGDYDSDEYTTLFDYYFVHDCLTKDGPGLFSGPDQNAGPGCRFTDFDTDADADLFDFAEFQNLFGGN